MNLLNRPRLLLRTGLVNRPSRAIMFNFRKDEENLYTMLEVKTTASAKEIKLAYYKLAKKYHPDF